MKISKLIIVLHFLSFATIYGQGNNNAIAKIRYQEAEELYEKGSYELSLKKLEQVESLLNSSNSKILYLKILIEDTLWRLDNQKVIMPYKRTLQIKNDINYYINYYYSASEEKLATIVKISERYQDLPLSFEDYKVMFEKRKAFWVNEYELEKVHKLNLEEESYNLENQIQSKIKQQRRKVNKMGLTGLALMMPLLGVGVYEEFKYIENKEARTLSYAMSGLLFFYGFVATLASSAAENNNERNGYSAYVGWDRKRLQEVQEQIKLSEVRISQIKYILDNSKL
jgi:hypothetical protein